jgi:hypothetical protein
MFVWSGNGDSDNDALTYDLNISCYPGCTIGNKLFSGLSASNYTLAAGDYLKYLSDNGFYYNWSVRANDGTTYGIWATPRKLSVSALVAISVLNDSIDFGTMNTYTNNKKNTTTNNPYPFVLQNDGNCFINVSVNATALWSSVALATKYFQFKVDNYTSELGSFDWASSQTNWQNLSTLTTMAVVRLDWNDTADSAEVDLLVEVPSVESPGTKRSNLTFDARLGE